MTPEALAIPEAKAIDIPLFHHGRDFEHTRFGEIWQTHQGVKPEHYSDVPWINGFKWLWEEIGFDPVFLGVGNLSDMHRMLGVRLDDWVYFSYSSKPPGIFMDYREWDLFLRDENPDLTTISHRLFRPDLTEADWLKKAIEDPMSVQYLVPSLDLTQADSISVKRRYLIGDLEDLGFKDVSINNNLF